MQNHNYLLPLHCLICPLQVLIWDTSAGNSPVAAIKEAHGSCDVHTVDWNGLREHLVVTGRESEEQVYRVTLGDHVNGT